MQYVEPRVMRRLADGPRASWLDDSASPDGPGRSAPAGPGRRALRCGLVLVTTFLVVLSATWPLASRVTAAIPLGAEQEATVPLFSLWTLWWTADRAAHAFRHYWDAPIFHPHHQVLALSEPQSLTGLLVSPLWAVGATPALVYNVAVLAVLLANGMFAYRLARAWPLPRMPALASGWLAVGMPFVAANLGVLPIMPVFGIAWTLEGAIRFARSGALRHVAWAGAGFLALFLASQQLALLFAPFALAASVLALAEHPDDARAARRALAVAGTLVVLIVGLSVPVLATHARLGLARPERLVQALSALPRDFVTRPATALLAFPPRAPAAAGDMGGLFPGFLVLALATGGVLAGIRAEGRTRAFALCLLGIVVASGVLALGLNVSLFGWRPFAALRMLVPGFDGLRSPFRYAALAQVGLVALGGLGLADVARRAPRRAAATAVALLGLLGTAENLSVPGRLLAVPPSPRTSWSAWLRDQPVGSILAHVPVAMGLHVSDYEPEAWRMFHQMDHRLPMLNGYSSYFPPGYGRFQFDVNRFFPTRPLLCFLAQGDLGITTIVVDRAWREARHPDLATPGRQPLLALVYADQEVEIYRLAVGAEDCRAGPGGSG